MAKAKAKSGRPSIFTEKLGSEICLRLAEGESLLSICKDPKMPARSVVYNWILDGKHKEFSDKYAKAREIQAEHMFEEIILIADRDEAEMTNRDRLRVDTRKWYLSKVLPKKFGDTSQQEINVNIDLAERIHRARMRIQPENRIFN